MELDGVQLTDRLRGRQVPLLLAYLVLNRSRHVGREELIEAMWPDQAPRSQDAALRTLLSRLRFALGGESLSGRDELMLSLPEPCWIDAEAAHAEVRRARGALERADARAAWALAQVPLNIATRGLLPGVEANWIEPHRRQLEDVRLEALEVIGRAGLGLGGTQLSSAERAARTLIEAEPYRESGYVLLMQALAAQGNLAEGLRVFDALRTLLRDELGTTPSAEALAVHERLLRPGWGPEAAGPDREREGASLELPPELVVRARPPLVGRGRELDELGRLWGAARAPDGDPTLGRGRLVVLAGDPGIGKTRLVAELARTAHEQHAFVLAGRSTRETLVPYQPFVEALRHYLINVSLAELRASGREYGAELARLVPELRRRTPELQAPAAAEPETERYRLFEAVVGLLTEISIGAPVLLVLDDLHWADRPSLLLLRHLARAAQPDRLLIVGTYRAVEAEFNGFMEVLADLRRERLFEQVDVGGLSEAETAELVKILTGTGASRTFARALHDDTGGNPFFIEEIVRHLGEAGVDGEHAGPAALQQVGVPQGVKDVIALRLARLDAEALECLRVASVIGRDFDVELLEQILALDEETFLASLDAAVAAGLVTESLQRPGRYSFAHVLVRDTVYDGMSAARRSRLHRRVGERVESAGGPRNLATLALHFTQAAGAGEAEKAIDYALRAGREAASMLAYEEATEHYERALEVLERFAAGDQPRRVELLLLLGEARAREGNRADAWSALREAARAARALGDGRSLAMAAIEASRSYVAQSGPVNDELVAMLEEALALDAEDRSIVRVLLLSRLCGALYYAPGRERIKQLSGEATALADELQNPEARAVAAAARRRAYWEPESLSGRLASATELLTLARQAGNQELSLQGHAWLVVDLLESGDRDAVEAQVAAFAPGAAELRQPLYAWNGAVWRAMLALLDGRLEMAEALAGRALSLGAQVEPITAAQYSGLQLMAIRQEQGRMGELEQPAREFVREYPTVPGWRAALARLLIELGRIEEAARELGVLLDQGLEAIPRDGSWIATMTLLAEVSTAVGAGEAAGRLYDLLLPYRDVHVVVGLGALCQGSAARYLGLLAGGTGSRERAVEHFELALAANAALRAPVCVARTQLDYAAALGDAPRARALIAAAAATAAELGLEAIGRRAAELSAQTVT